MKNSALEKNKRYSNKFVQSLRNSKVPEEIKDIFAKKRIKSLIDLGCGDGVFINAIKKEFPFVKITGIDISPRRIKNLKEIFPRDAFYERDVCNTKLKTKFDFVHSSQVIEHVEEDRKMVKEMGRLLKENGILFVSSVIKKFPFPYFYVNKGKFVLDPTHEREYKNQKEFLDLFKKDFELIKSWVNPVKRKFKGISIKIPSYYLVYGMWKKKKK